MAPSLSTSVIALVLLALQTASATQLTCTPNPIPQDLTCGAPSFALTASHFTKATSSGDPVASPDKCAAFCAGHHDCAGFWWAPISGGVPICQLFTGPLAESVRLDSNSPFKVYDVACYSCSHDSPPPSSSGSSTSSTISTSSTTSTTSSDVSTTSSNVSTTSSTTSSIATTIPAANTTSVTYFNTTSSVVSTSSIPASSTTLGYHNSTTLGHHNSTTTLTSSSTTYSSTLSGSSSTTLVSSSSETSSTTSSGSSYHSTSSTPSTSAGTPTGSTTTHASSGYPVETSTQPTEYTTSTVYATSIYTITSCAPTITNCPVGSVTTETSVRYTTVCPVTKVYHSGTRPTSAPGAGIPSGYKVSTVYTTVSYTITQCPPAVTNCPVGSITTETRSLYTTICPISGSQTSVPVAVVPVKLVPVESAPVGSAPVNSASIYSAPINSAPVYSVPILAVTAATSAQLSSAISSLLPIDTSSPTAIETPHPTFGIVAPSNGSGTFPIPTAGLAPAPVLYSTWKGQPVVTSAPSPVTANAGAVGVSWLGMVMAGIVGMCVL